MICAMNEKLGQGWPEEGMMDEGDKVEEWKSGKVEVWKGGRV